MTLREQLLHLASLFAAQPEGGASLSTVSSRIFNDGKALARITSGGDLTTGNFEKALRWFSANWPDGAAWPESVPRPDPAVTGNQQEVFPS